MKICSFFVAPKYGQALLGMPDIKTLGILIINCNTLDMKEVERTENRKTNTDIRQEPTSEKHYVNIRQEAGTTEKCCTNTDSILNFENKDKATVTDNDNIEYFIAGPNWNINKRVSAEISHQLQREFKDVFNGIRSFNGSFSLQIKPDSKPYQVTPRNVAYALQNPFKEELDELWQQDIITPLDGDETVKWSNSFVLVQNLNGKVRLCLDPARLNQAVIRLVHRGPPLNDKLPKLNNAHVE